MKKIVLGVLVFGWMLTACSGTASPSAPAATATEPVMESTMTAAPLPTATEAVTPTAAPSTGGKVQVQVTEGDNWIKSDLTTFRVGTTYVFTVSNTGHRAHSFSISRPVTDRSLDGIGAAQVSALVLVPKDQLPPGAVVAVEYTFTEPAPAGTLELACLILMHYNMGQHLAIVVE